MYAGKVKVSAAGMGTDEGSKPDMSTLGKHNLGLLQILQHHQNNFSKSCKNFCSHQNCSPDSMKSLWLKLQQTDLVLQTKLISNELIALSR